MSVYDDWIRDYGAAHDGYVAGLCGSATREMVAAFPELKRVPGTAYSAVRSGAHWWCESPDGTVVDPTVAQFGGCAVQYVAWKPGDETRVGRCMNCGNDIYRRVESLTEGLRTTFCQDECEAEFCRDQFGDAAVARGCPS